MSSLDSALKELNRNILFIKFFDVALKTMVVFALFILIATFFQLSLWLTLIPTAIYFAYKIIQKVNLKSYSEVEERVPLLKDALRTAADNRRTNTVLAQELHGEVLSKMSAIKTSLFVEFGSATKDLMMLALLSFLIIGLATFNVNYSTTKDFAMKNTPLGKLTGDASLTGGTPAGKAIYKPGKNNNSLFGAANVVTVGSDALEVKIDPITSGANLKDIQEAKKNDFNDVNPDEISGGAQAGCGQDCAIPKENQEIIKNYYDKVGIS